ncbi:histone H3.v1-like [Macrobrachium nipponense]|uniref:histone H3.v1-like n=1 Tax=Macrobrachium nipponense TaxID=159736 RepID=UPI0030C86F57
MGEENERRVKKREREEGRRKREERRSMGRDDEKKEEEEGNEKANEREEEEEEEEEEKKQEKPRGLFACLKDPAHKTESKQDKTWLRRFPSWKLYKRPHDVVAICQQLESAFSDEDKNTTDLAITRLHLLHQSSYLNIQWMISHELKLVSMKRHNDTDL